jgi:hypothetical protein
MPCPTRWIRRLLPLLGLLASLLPAAAFATAATADDSVLIEAIVRAGCGHCADEKAFLQSLQAEDARISVRLYDIAETDGSQWFKAATQAFHLPLTLPITLVGREIVQGFDSAETTGAQIRRLLETQRGQPHQGFAALLAEQPSPPAAQTAAAPLLVKLPLLGVHDVAAWPLPALSAILGFLDGFNPCAMWVLVTFLLALMQLGSRRRMWTVAGLFIVAETLMYYLILNLWFRVWDFVGMDRYVTPLVGALVMGGGLFFLYEWYKSLGTAMACRVMDLEQRSRLVQRIRRLADGPLTVATAVGIVGLAFSVNVVEFACSIGYPQTFSKIIEMNGLGFWSTQACMAIYIVFYMLDDFAVFALALWGFEQIQLTQRYSRWSTGLGGLLMLFLGWVLWFRPEWLRFG